MAMGVGGAAAVKVTAIDNLLENRRNGIKMSGVERQGAGNGAGDGAGRGAGNGAGNGAGRGAGRGAGNGAGRGAGCDSSDGCGLESRKGAGCGRRIAGFEGPHVGEQPELLSKMKEGLKIGPKRNVRRTKPILPPGAGNFERFTKQCTSCHLCVAKCPVQVIKPSLLDYGLGGIMQPMMNFDRHYCNYDCTICSDVCPTDALLPLTREAKHHNQMGVVQLYLENCIVYTDDTSCGACSEHCPTQAVRMVPYKPGLTMPEIHPEICVGCGGCEYICPALPWKAIFVEGIAEHATIELEFEEAKEYDIDDFGF